MNEFKEVTTTEPPISVEVIGYNPEWVDEDFNPKGTRICFRLDECWVLSVWVDYQDDYISQWVGLDKGPTHYLEIPFFHG